MKRAWCIVALLIVFCGFVDSEAKKVRSSLRIEKQSKSKTTVGKDIEGRKINLNDSVSTSDLFLMELMPQLRNCRFTGYEKEVNSGKETFILNNLTDRAIKGFTVKIDYLDMKGRMLHSQTITESCDIPKGETRRFNIKSWDEQHSYYYYRGNEPRKVATPFQVKFHPISFWVEE